jgi:hypothetical protein
LFVPTRCSRGALKNTAPPDSQDEKSLSLKGILFPRAFGKLRVNDPHAGESAVTIPALPTRRAATRNPR